MGGDEEILFDFSVKLLTRGSALDYFKKRDMRSLTLKRLKTVDEITKDTRHNF